MVGRWQEVLQVGQRQLHGSKAGGVYEAGKRGVCRAWQWKGGEEGRQKRQGGTGMSVCRQCEVVWQKVCTQHRV